jgi:Domain of unknown function (DUF4440)
VAGEEGRASMTPKDPIEQELDGRHAAAQDAFSKRDLDAYRAIFSASLRYRQANGKVIDRNRLMRNVASQFRRLGSVQSSFVRERLTVIGNEATETLDQSATAVTTVFGVVHRRWLLHRRGEYSWAKSDGVWKIEKVTILSENLTSSWHLGLRLWPKSG